MARSILKENKFFRQAHDKAGKIAKDPGKMEELVAASREKLQQINFEDSKISRLADRIRIIIRMVRAYAKGSYRQIPWKSILALVAGLVYFIMPLDLLPDFIPVTGFLDDFTIIMLITGAFQQDIQDFLLWEEDQEKQ